MPFLDKKGVRKVLHDIEIGKCTGQCRSVWTRNIGYALKTKTNPLNLTKKEYTEFREKLAFLHGKRIGKEATVVNKKKSKIASKKKSKIASKKRASKSSRQYSVKPLPAKYYSRPSPPFPANDYQGKTKRGNDKRQYVSVPNKNDVYRWILKH